MASASVAIAPERSAANTVVEIGPRRVAAAEQRRLALVELRIGERDVAQHDADQHVAAAMGDESEAGVHRRRRAGAVEHAIEEIAAGQRPQPVARALARLDRMFDADRLARESEPVGARVEHRHVAAARAGEDRGREADRAGADDHDLLAGRDRAAPRRMRADGEKLGHRRLVEADALGVDEIALRHASQSAMPPSLWTPITFMRWQQLVLPRRQATQWPQAR